MPLLEDHVKNASRINLIGEAWNAVDNVKNVGQGRDIANKWLAPNLQSSKASKPLLITGQGYQCIAILQCGLEATSILLSIIITPEINQCVVSLDGIEVCVALMR